MNKIPRKIKYLVYGFCGLIFTTLTFGLGVKIQIGLIENLQKMTDHYLGFSTTPLDYLMLASIPFFGMLYNATRREFKKTELIMDMLTVLFCVIIISGIGFYVLTFIGGKPQSPLMPQNFRIEPFGLYSTLLIGLGISTPFLILKLVKNTKSNRTNE